MRRMPLFLCVLAIAAGAHAQQFPIPGKLNYASFGAGTTAHLNGEWLRRLTGIDIVHVPYKGAGDAMKGLLAGEVQLFFDGVDTAIRNTKSDRWAGVIRDVGVKLDQ